MSPKVRELLAKYTPNPLALGPSFEAQKLQQELQGLLANLRRIYWVTVAMILVVFVLEVLIAAIYIREPLVLSGIAAAMGVTIWSSVERMSHLSKEMAETTLLVTLSDGLSQEAIERVVEQLLKK
ncbi:MAG: hypothetical protein EKK33_29180 [Bradyrhizobiaceae bacterium]|nr:MAG: hypothetical protein EKK33_29180 [Bradyrhizobiaceae bacterium]